MTIWPGYDVTLNGIDTNNEKIKSGDAVQTSVNTFTVCIRTKYISELNRNDFYF